MSDGCPTIRPRSRGIEYALAVAAWRPLHPDTVDSVIGKVLHNPGLTWAEQDEAWLRRRKAEFCELLVTAGPSLTGRRHAGSVR
ncbi:hypothetical protein [Streptomyces chartreusis]|uniref:hypothetical protein n=1 Tax=Streptomyces chartreusis TaxID=1969 RepID=UPI003803B4A6